MKRILTLALCFLANNLNLKVALITGITGQDGSYLAELLLEKGYEVHGVVRKVTSFNIERSQKVLDKSNRIRLHYGDITSFMDMTSVINKVKPDEIYNLGALSHVHDSFTSPHATALAAGIGVLNLLEVVRLSERKIKFYQASSSEMFGLVQEIPQKETTPFRPRSPYASSKLFAHWLVTNYRESYGIFAVSGILFNHESPRRGENFVTRKITLAVADIANGSLEPLVLGNLDSKRDWGYAKDYVYAMWLMMQQETPEDYVIGTGETHTVREFVELAFKEIGIEIKWQGYGVDEVGLNSQTNETLVMISPEFFRPAEVDILLADMSRAKNKLGWEPKVKFTELIKIMVNSDLKGKQ